MPDPNDTPQTYKFDFGDGEKDYTPDQLKDYATNAREYNDYKQTHKYTDDDLNKSAYDMAVQTFTEWINALNVDEKTNASNPAPAAGGQPNDKLVQALNQQFGTYNQYISQLSDAIADDRLNRYVEKAKAQYPDFDEERFLHRLARAKTATMADVDALAKAISEERKADKEAIVNAYIEDKKKKATTTKAITGGEGGRPGAKQPKTLDEAVLAAKEFVRGSVD